MIQDEEIQTLINLGLSLLQARTYLGLAKLGKAADVQTIAKTSNVARQDMYRIMTALERRGLAEKIIAKKNMYIATPMKQGLSILLQKRKEEYAELEKRTSLLLSNFQQNSLQDLHEQNQQFKVTSDWKLLKKMHEEKIQSTRTSIDITVPGKHFQRMLFDQLPCLKEAKRKGVRIRAITEKFCEKAPSRKTQVLTKNLFAEVKYIDNPTLFGMHIFDSKEVTMDISERHGLPSLWSNDPNVVRMAETYFEHIWNNRKCN